MAQMITVEDTNGKSRNLSVNTDNELVTQSKTGYVDEDGSVQNVNIQNPLPVDGDSVYTKDIWVEKSIIGDFSGSVLDLFDNLHSFISNITASNPKEILIHFQRTIVSNVVGLGSYSGNFSNTLIQIGTSGNVFTTVIDESTSDTKYTSRTFQLPITAGFNSIKFQFHTTDTVTLSNMVILKTVGVISRLQAAKPDNTVTDINATNGGNLKVSLEELESGISVNSNSQLKSTLFDEAGNAIASHLSVDGGYHLATAIMQDINSSEGNSTTTNLNSGATFTGTSDQTFGINGIQIYHFADQDCTIYVEQSLDNSNWDIQDSFTCLANEACTRTFISVAPYFRLRVTNNGLIATTDIRVSAGLTPVINPLPRSLTPDDRLKVETTLTGKENTERHLWVAPTNSISVDQEVRLVGTNFDGTTKDTNFWSETVTGTGAVIQTGEIKLNTGVTANSTALYESVRRARFVVGAALLFTGAYKFNDALVVDNIRRCGAYDDDEGFFFELDGNTFNIGSRKVTVDTLVSSGNFNGNYGPNFIDPTKYYKLAIEWTPLGAFYYINNILLHKSTGGHLTRKLTLPIRFENNNTNGIITDVTFDCLGVVIMREGHLKTNATYKYIAGAATTILKYGAGDLHTIVNNDNSGSIIVYDNTAGSGTIIAAVDLAKVLGTLTFDAPFSNGLTVVSTGAGVKITVTYE